MSNLKALGHRKQLLLTLLREDKKIFSSFMLVTRVLEGWRRR